MKCIFILAFLIPQIFSTSLNAQIKFRKEYVATDTWAALGSNDACVLQSFNGEYYVGSTANINNRDFFLMKLNLLGDTLWTKTYGGNFDDYLLSMEQTSDSGLIIAGSTRSFSMGQFDALVIKTDSDGNIIWSKNYGGFDPDWFSSIYQTSDNGYIALGTSSTFNSGISNLYLVKLDATGNIQWTRTLGGTWVDEGYSIRPTFDNGYIISGSTKSFTATSGRIYLIKTDSVGVPVWSKIFGGVMGEDGQSVRQCADSGFVVTGYTNSFGNGASDAFLLKTNLNGDLQWMKTYGGSFSEIGYQVEITNDGGFILAARTQSFTWNNGVYLIKTNSIGDTLWTRNYLCPVNNGYAVQQTNDNGYIVVTTKPFLTVFKTDSLGNIDCNDFSTNTIVTNANPIITTGVNISSGGVANVAAVPLKYTAFTLNTVCLTLYNNELNQDLKLNVFPNPSHDKLTIELPVYDFNAVTFSLKNLAGQSLIIQKEMHFGSNIFTMDLHYLSNGIYFLETIAGEKHFVQKIIKQ